ncbi:endo-alpha-N-acetylgalactosaminidase family protein [Pseudoflavonifractor sp.]|uniref:endo-alpha-N-acetylgalactosaminidase family protein n=1 Tax=Pseudoflavonifractor sp. TaxID=1980281 RepID=UPI003D9390A3
MRKKESKRPLALLLAVALCIGMLPMPALAAEQEMELTAPSAVSSDASEETEVTELPYEAQDGIYDEWVQDEKTDLGDGEICEVADGRLHLKASISNNNVAGDPQKYPAAFVDKTASSALAAAGDTDKFIELTVEPVLTKRDTRFGVYLNYSDPGNAFFLGFDSTGWFYQLYKGGEGSWAKSGVSGPDAGESQTLRMEWNGTTLTKATVDGTTIFENVDFSQADNTAADVVALKLGASGIEGETTEVYLSNISYTGQNGEPVTDETTPELVRAVATSLDTVTLTFNEKLDKASAENTGNYTFDSETVTVESAALAEDGKTVALTVAGLTAGAAVTLTISGIADLAGNAVQQPITEELQAPQESGAGSWVMQEQATSESVELQPGWITATENGVIINHSKIIEDTGKQGWVIFDSAAEQYRNSVLEYDITFTDPAADQGEGFINVAPATRVLDGSNYEGFAIDTPAALQRTGRKDGVENYGGVTNLTGTTFEYGVKYHLRMVTVENSITVYITEPGKEEQKLTTFESPIGLDAGTYGFRIWRGGKTITVENIQRSEYIASSADKSSENITEDDWGTENVVIPVTFGTGDSVTAITNGDSQLEEGTDYILGGDSITLKKEYILKQPGSFTLNIAFAKGSTDTFSVVKVSTTQVEYVWTPDKGLDEWTKLSGSGTYEMSVGAGGDPGMLLKGQNFLMNENAPMTANGEIEITCEFMSDKQSCVIGGLFRVDPNTGAWQSVGTNRDFNATAYWDYTNSEGASQQLVWDGALWVSRLDVKDNKVKVRCEGDSMTVWLDDQFTHTAGVSQAKEVLGGMGIQTAATGDVLIKKVVFRTVVPFVEAEETEPLSISSDGLTVRLAGDFPRVLDYSLNGKTLNGAELRYNYVTINTVDYPATAVAEPAEDGKSVTYHVTPEGSGVTFDVVFTVLDDQILEMRINNIVEPEGEQVNSITLPRQPLISANSGQEGAKFDAAWMDKNDWAFRDIHETIADRNVSTTADRTVIIPIISANGLSAAMTNNIYIDGDEFRYRAFELPDGEVSVGVWNTDFMYRGLDDEKILPFASEPDEADLYCRVVITEDNNGDGVTDWQDGGNALRNKLVGDQIPGGDEAARTFFHVGYNFASGAQQPFLKVADNMKRLSNYMDGFGQTLIFKGYANEGHDSGHADYNDINHRAGGAEDMNVAIAEADKINSNFGIHINAHEAYPEAKMFNDHVISQRNAWAWMDQSRNIRRDIDMLEGSFDWRLDQLFDQTPDLDFVYVDCWEGDRWDELKLIGNMMGNGAEMFGTENATDLNRFGVWVHSTGGTSANSVHHFVYGSQRDVYGSSPIYWGGYNRAASMMSWQHNNNINTLVEQFYTNQLPEKYLMCHTLKKDDGTTAWFEDGVTSSNWVITKDGNKLTDGQGKIFIPWYAEDSETRNPDEAAKIYHWNADGGETTWTLPASWSGLKNVYLYETTQTGKKLVDTIEVKNGQIIIEAEPKTPYVVYPGEAEADVTEWSVGSPIKDTGFNSRDFSIWQKDGEADIQFNDDGNGVSILTMTGAEAGQVSQTMTGLVPGQKYRVLIYAGAENGKTARLTVETPDGKKYENYLEQVVMANQYFDNYALGKMVQLMWVDFVQPEGETTAKLTLSADACESGSGKATFMESRIVKTAEPDLAEGYVANETFEYVEQGAYGIFSPEGASDGVPHLSETHEGYTSDTINGNWSLKLYGHQGQGRHPIRTSPATMRLMPNCDYTMEFETIGSGKVYVVSESDSADKVLEEAFSDGHNTFQFTTGAKNDYIVRIEGGDVLDDFKVYYKPDPTPPTVPGNLTAQAVENSNGVKLTWEAATDDDGRVSSYRIYRDGALLAVVSSDVTTYTDMATQDETEYTYQVSAVNGGATEGEKSAEAKVTTGILPPAAIELELDGSDTAVVTFNKQMERESAENPANYRVTGADVTVISASLNQNGKSVTLTLSGLSALDMAQLTVENVKDLSGKNTVSGSDTFILSLLYHYYKLDEEAGQAAADEAGHASGTKTGGVTSVDGKDGKAAGFGGSDYIEVDSDALYQQDTFTVSAWINWDGSSGVNAIVGNDISGDAGSRGIIFYVGSDGELRCNSNVAGMGGSEKVTANEWHHVAFVKQTGSAQLYLDGKQIGNEALQYGVETRVGFRIGGSHKGGGGLSYPFHGAIDEVRIFTTSLTEAEVGILAGLTPEPTPEAEFDAATMQLSNVDNGMVYSLDGGKTWLGIEGESVDLSGAAVTAANGIQVKRLGSGEDTIDSEIQKIVLTQAEQPSGVTGRDETEARNDGALVGTTADMEYRLSQSGTWQVCGAETTAVDPGTYEVRTAGRGTMLASESVIVVVNAYKDAIPPAVNSYIIKATAGEGGSISPTGSIVVQRGQNKTFTITANEGYVIADVLVDGESVGAVSAYTFENVRGKHTIEAVFKTSEGGGTGTGFTDVPADTWYSEAVEYVTEKGLMNGTGEGTFNPLMNLSRSMMAQIFYNMEQRPALSGSNPFTDVAEGQWYTDAVIWAAEQEIVNGYGGAFQPDGDITREQLAAMLYRYAAYKQLDVTASDDALNAFADGGTVSDWAADAMAWAVEEGILTGKNGGLLDPQGNATRAEVAVILMRFTQSGEQQAD